MGEIGLFKCGYFMGQVPASLPQSGTTTIPCFRVAVRRGIVGYQIRRVSRQGSPVRQRNRRKGLQGYAALPIPACPHANLWPAHPKFLRHFRDRVGGLPALDKLLGAYPVATFICGHRYPFFLPFFLNLPRLLLASKLETFPFPRVRQFERNDTTSWRLHQMEADLTKPKRGKMGGT